MQIKVKWHEDMWQEIKDSALFTIHKENGKYPTSEWKRKLILSEHSPIRRIKFATKIINYLLAIIQRFVFADIFLRESFFIF